jgi:ADP-heptose:LPS heptosyltransferase
MGYGDQLMASGMARGAWARGKRIAFGNGIQIIWDQHSAEVFRGNPNIVSPGSESADGIVWIPYYKGHRLYNRHDKIKDRWVWNMDFHALPGEIFLDKFEVKSGERFGKGFVVIEPQSAPWKSVAANKDWGRGKFQAVADRLRAGGHKVVQFQSDRGSPVLAGVMPIKTTSFRDAVAVLSHAAIYIGSEGGLHHAAAAVGIPAVVLFGGFIPPSVTGYATHANLTGGAEACGSLKPCAHCRKAMEAISVEEVLEEARERL